ncbi:uncharacterized protein OCT59_001836 [Rhizophagus irregularis]|uniref:Uncharacterized protein n=1 Tax=Rhizophagus irregularis (strain DAOM 181602 / DAOM 197198 / MUCL 43194) TaxID=747089 RepID=A0A2P4P3I0_RHIID|nr:hypothetical protein GLOIN_2v814012 [Rhizophagus irregularis DAOM 181602=DAOM 197198]POG59925.1 hypothetical protein GLOIN_2v814012 [Rhizophagus irregularis DAOM 181602=DAOM 197198]UZO10240.1 hypothetical protein OCT59_001836 [Rhizophagus irregularis]|eukprot:XP_025166791.1 hypothetical protein GLOIN_2v814012 [Rhizophagus irregularis DAOM 181602=DAOM 197198]
MFDSQFISIFCFFLFCVLIVFVIFRFPFSSVYSCTSFLHLTDEDGVGRKDILGKFMLIRGRIIKEYSMEGEQILDGGGSGGGIIKISSFLVAWCADKYRLRFRIAMYYY